MAWGALVWLMFAVVAVGIRGVAWDEAYERAQVMTGAAAYPAWHPLYQYAWRAFGLHYLSAAALLKMTGSAFVVCGLRNVLALWMTILPPFLLGASLARRVLWGYVAATLVFLGVHLQFASYYPLFVWPDMFTSGHIGMGYALCTLWAWMTRRVRLGAFLLGAMPLVHVGQMPPVLGVVLLMLAWAAYRGESLPWRQMLPWAALGLGLVAAYAVLRYATLPAMPAETPFVASGKYADAWARYTAHNDVHRAYPRYGQVGNSFMALLALLVVTALCRVREARHARNAPFEAKHWLFVYGGLCLASFTVAIVTTRFLGESVPFLLVSWMPQRLANHAAVLLVAAVCGVLGRSRGGVVVLIFALVLQATKPLLQVLLPATLFDRYLAPPEMLLFLLTGAAIMLALRVLLPTAPLLLALLITLPIGLYHQTGAAYASLGVLLAVAAPVLLPRWRFSRVITIAPLLVLCMALALRQAEPGSSAMRVTDDDSALREAMASHPEAMLVTPHWEINMQERTGHPMLVTYETHQFIPYVPELAPGIEQMYHEVYGLRFGEPWRYDLEAWATRTAGEWHLLAKRYGFRYVLAPALIHLPLPRALRAGESWVLYDAAVE